MSFKSLSLWIEANGVLPDLHVSIDEPVELEVFIVVAEGVDQLFGDLQGQNMPRIEAQVRHG